MREIALFVEDNAHRQVVGALAKRLADERGVVVDLDWRNAVGGHGTVVREFKRYLRDLERQGGRQPDLIVVAADANCRIERAYKGIPRHTAARSIASRNSRSARRALAFAGRHRIQDYARARLSGTGPEVSSRPIQATPDQGCSQGRRDTKRS